MVDPPVLIPPQKHKPLKLYLSADESAIGSALIQEFEGKERVIYYVSRRLLDAETRYSPVERLCLCFYFSCTKLRHYLLSAECTMVCKEDVVKSVLSMQILNGRIGKWIPALSKFDLRYQSAEAVKGRVMDDFGTHHCGIIVGQMPQLWNLLHGHYFSMDPLVVTDAALGLFLYRLGGQVSSPPCQFLPHQPIIKRNMRLCLRG